MNDRLRFRCWNGQDETMYEVVELNNGKPTILQNPINKNYKMVGVSGNVLQCTGMKDNTGQYLYEGDVVKNLGEYRRNELGIVVWEMGSWLVKYSSVNETGHELDMLYQLTNEISKQYSVFANVDYTPNMFELVKTVREKLKL